jgi:hypothetical protein
MSFEIVSGHPLLFSITSRNSKIHVTWSDGVLSSVDGIYTIRYISFYEQGFVLPDHADILTTHHSDCTVDFENFIDANYDIVVFRIDNPEQEIKSTGS